jgi:hypothetical protein
MMHENGFAHRDLKPNVSLILDIERDNSTKGYKTNSDITIEYTHQIKPASCGGLSWQTLVLLNV